MLRTGTDIIVGTKSEVKLVFKRSYNLMLQSDTQNLVSKIDCSWSAARVRTPRSPVGLGTRLAQG